MKQHYGKICLLSIVVLIIVGIFAFKTFAAPGTDFGFIVYNNTDYAFTAPWMQLVNKSDGKTFRPSTSAFALDHDVKLTDTRPTTITTANGYAFTIPATLPNGEYDLLIKDSADGSEATTDVTVVGFRLLMPSRVLYNPTSVPQDLGKVRVQY